jgi:hypothetical protein
MTSRSKNTPFAEWHGIDFLNPSNETDAVDVV